MRPSDHEFGTEFGGGLEAWHPDCAGLAWARLYAEAQRARAAEAEKEAKLREAEAQASATVRRAEGHISRAEVAERENRLASARIAELEAKLRVAEQGHALDMERYATRADERIRVEMQRAEKAERERDEAQRSSESAVQALGAMRDELVSAGYPGGDREVALANLRQLVKDRDEARAALREARRWAHQGYHPRDHDVDTCPDDECRMYRAALGEKP